MGLTFDEFRETNVARCKRWHPDFLEATDQSWTGADWSNAMCGEAGEAAARKFNRISEREGFPERIGTLV